jgi:Superinfection immunity protein
MKWIILATMPFATTSTVAASNGGDATHGLMVLIALLAIYFLPWFVARSRQHHATDGILIANLVLGWTVVGWFGALAWSVMPVRVATASLDYEAAARSPAR